MPSFQFINWIWMDIKSNEKYFILFCWGLYEIYKHVWFCCFYRPSWRWNICLWTFFCAPLFCFDCTAMIGSRGWMRFIFFLQKCVYNAKSGVEPGLDTRHQTFLNDFADFVYQISKIFIIPYKFFCSYIFFIFYVITGYDQKNYELDSRTKKYDGAEIGIHLLNFLPSHIFSSCCWS